MDYIIEKLENIKFEEPKLLFSDKIKMSQINYLFLRSIFICPFCLQIRPGTNFELFDEIFEGGNKDSDIFRYYCQCNLHENRHNDSILCKSCQYPLYSRFSQSDINSRKNKNISPFFFKYISENNFKWPKITKEWTAHHVHLYMDWITEHDCLCSCYLTD